MMTIERAGEQLARRLDRRRFLRRSAATVFSAAAALAVRGLQVPGVSAYHVCYTYENSCSCHPLNGWYCNQWNGSYCNGPLCSGGCGYNNTIYGQACWCTQTCDYGGSGGYYECCDCDCIDPAGNSQGCTCGGFVQTY